MELVIDAITACTPDAVREAARALVLPDARFEVVLGP
jgi:hypothetical protein